MDIKEKQAFDEYFQEKYPELYKDVFNEDGDERAIIGYSFALSAWQARAKAQTVPEGFVLVKQVHPDSIVHNQGLGLFKECQVIYGWNGKSKEFKDALNKGFYYGVKSGAKAVFETTVKPQESTIKKPHMEHLEYLFLGWLLLGLIGFGLAAMGH